MSTSLPRPRRGVPALLLLAGVAAACGRGDTGGADSALSRDLTLAAATTPSPSLTDSVMFSDTAITAPPSGRARATEPASASVARPQTPRPVAARATAAPETRPSPRTESRPAPAPPPVAGRSPAAAVPTPAAVPAAPAAGGTAAGARRGAIGAGTTLAATTAARICTESTRPGDRVVATLAGEVTGSDGATLPAGTSLVLEIARVTVGKGGDAGHVELIARGVARPDGSYQPLVADVAVADGAMERHRVEKGANDDRGKVVKGAIAGAILGQILGRGARGTIIGAAGGAAAGAAAAAASTKYEACLPAGAKVTVRLTEPLAAE